MSSFGNADAPKAFGRRPASLTEIKAAADELGIDVFFEPEHWWIAQEYLCSALPPGWEQCWDETYQAWYYNNTTTNQLTWFSPNIAYYKGIYRQESAKERGNHHAVVRMESRKSVILAKEKKKNKIQPTKSKNAVSRRGSMKDFDDAEKEKSKGHLADFRRKSLASSHSDITNPETLMYTPDSFGKLCEHLGVHIFDPKNPELIECSLIRFVLEFLDRIHANTLPDGWATYHDEQDFPYYYNENTGVNTYDHPLAAVVVEEIKQARKQHGKAGDNNRLVSDEWVAFGTGVDEMGKVAVQYHNFRTGKTMDGPPHIGRDAAQEIARCLRGDMAGITKTTLTSAFDVFDANSSGTISMLEMVAVLQSLGSLDSGEIETFQSFSNTRSQNELFSFVPVVNTLLDRVSSGKTVSKGHKSVKVHGHVHDATAEANTLLSEEQAWEKESQLWEIKKGLEVFIAKVDQAAGNPGDAWTIIDYNQVMDLLARARDADAFNIDDPYHVKCFPVCKRAQELSGQYEEAEALRQAREMLAQQNEAQNQLAADRDMSLKKMTALTVRIKAVKVIEFTGGHVLTDLNGFLFPEVAELEKYVGQSADLLIRAQELHDRLPTRDADLKANMVKKFVQQVNRLEEMVKNSEKCATVELSQRAHLESEATRAREKEALDRAKAEKEAIEKKAKLEEEQKKALDQLDKERIEAEKIAEALAQKKQEELAKEREAMAIEMEKLRLQHENQHKELEAWAAGFQPDEFATAEELEEAEIKREIELEERRIKDEEEAIEMEKKRVLMEAEMRRKEEELAAQLKKAAEERRIDEERKRQMELELQRFEDAKKRDEERKRLKEKEQKRRARQQKKAREAVDADDDDTEEELRAREQAVEQLKEYNGDVWDACKAGDIDTVRNFFLVHGSAKLLEGKMSRCHHRDEWGRTLLHMASWWGNIKLIEYLCVLGADVNAIDTSCSRTTPLIEAARAGQRVACETLIRRGANIRHQDAQGDTAIHWASRRGWGTLLRSLVRTSEDENKGSSSHLLSAKNNKLHTPIDVATNETVRMIIRAEMTLLGELHKERKHVLGKLKKGFAHAKILGGNASAVNKSLLQNKRYGRGKHKKKHDSDSHDSVPETRVKKKKKRKHREKHHEERKLEKQMNAAHHDTGDGGVPDELLAMGIGLDDFHYGTRD